MVQRRCSAEVQAHIFELHDARGRVVTDPTEDRHARDVVFEKYQPRNDGELVTWRERALPIAVELV